jgi:hypothetical protein
VSQSAFAARALSGMESPAIVDLFWKNVQNISVLQKKTLGYWVSDMPGPCSNGTKPCPVLPINTSVLRNTSTVVSAYQSNWTAAELIDAGRPTIASYGNYYLASGDSKNWQVRANDGSQHCLQSWLSMSCFSFSFVQAIISAMMFESFEPSYRAATSATCATRSTRKGPVWRKPVWVRC